MNMKQWNKLTDEEREQILADLRKKWPRFKNTHPRQEKSTTGGWKDVQLKDFIFCMDKGLFFSWREFKREYETQRFAELKEDMLDSTFWKNYEKKFPYVVEIIQEVVNSRRMGFEKTQTFIRLMLNSFCPDGWPFRRGEEE